MSVSSVEGLGRLEQPIYLSRSKPKILSYKQKAILGVGAAAIAAVVVILTVYFLSPAAHSWIHSHIITPFNQLSGGNKLLVISSTIVGASSIVTLMVYLAFMRFKDKYSLEEPNFRSGGPIGTRYHRKAC